jgi:hypothetical protein
MQKIFPFDRLSGADLIIDAIYEGGVAGNVGDDPLSKLLQCGNQGGFRKVGSPNTKYVVLYSSLEDQEWPDHIDIAKGTFTYFGDNKTPGNELHGSSRGGNELLRDVFENVHANPPKRNEIPPFFVFTKHSTSSSRSVQFLGLAVPGAEGVRSTDDLVAVWKSAENLRFQNYKSIFTILDVATISREWLEDLYAGQSLTNNAPSAWMKWVNSGQYQPLTAQPSITYRHVSEQIPQTRIEREIVSCIFDYFKDNPTKFEACAAEIASLQDPNIVIDEITQPSVDGGRDAIGRYRIGPASDPLYMDFALEAKCYNPGFDGGNMNTVGVREVARLISRLRHRQFGIFVTTSVVARQAYEEIRADGHPVVILCGRDIANVLISKDLKSKKEVMTWLNNKFPLV